MPNSHDFYVITLRGTNIPMSDRIRPQLQEFVCKRHTSGDENVFCESE